MSELARGFHNFQIGDNPYELGGGAVRELAALTNIELGDAPTATEIQEKLFANWGKEKEYRTNAEAYEGRLNDGQTAREHVANLVERSGITNRIEPRRIDGKYAERGERRRLLLPGGVLNWMLRRADLGVDLLEQGYLQAGDGALLLAGGRRMTSPTEADTEFVQRWQASHDGQPPRELDYQHTVNAPRLGALGLRVRELYFDEPEGSKTAVGFKDQIKAASGMLTDGDILLVQNAPASSTWADVRGVVGDEQLYFAADSIAVARSDRQEADSLHYQKYSSAPSALARWVKAIHEINTHRSD